MTYKKSIAAFALILGFMGSASATPDKTYSFVPTNFSDYGGTFSGSLTYNFDQGIFTSWDISTTSVPSFAGFHYTQNNSTILQGHPWSVWEQSKLFMLYEDGNYPHRLISSDLYDAIAQGMNVNFNVSEDDQFGRLQRHAVIAAVPEPETYAMLLAGLGLMGAAVKRRKVKQA
jgi:hypothetical protein